MGKSKKINKIYAIGDIHGELGMVQRIIDRINVKKDDLIIFMGDYIDRGKYSFEVINFLLDLDKRFRCVFLKGNHESMFVDYLSGIYEQDFMINGGNKTLKSYFKNGYNIQRSRMPKERKIPPEHEDFLLNKTKLYYETDKYIFVHAGLWPGKTDLSTQPKEVLLWERQHFIKSKFDWGKKVIFGHTAFKEPYFMENKIGIDTGACFKEDGGKLTCLILPDETFIQQGPLGEAFKDEDDDD